MHFSGPRAAIVLGLLFSDTLGGCPSATSVGLPETIVTTVPGGSVAGVTITGSPEADEVFKLVNEERTSRGLAPLSRHSLLDAAAAAHARDMSENGFFAHIGSDGSNVGVRAARAGYGWTWIGENIGLGDLSPRQMMDLWMNSPGHRANILNPNFVDLGVATVDGERTLWVQVFGAQ